MSESTLSEILSAIDSADAKTTVTQQWMQGRAAFGGLGAAMAATGMRNALPEGKSMRSLMVSFVGPIPAEEVTVKSELMREGKNVSQVTSRIMAGDNICLHASAAFGSARDTKTASPVAEYKPEPKDSVPVLDASQRKLPPFIGNFEVHWTGGGIPLSGTGDRRLGQWVRHATDMRAFPLEKIIAIGDIPPPIMMAHYTHPVRTSSLSWSLEFVKPAEEVESDWFYLDYTLDAAAGGYCQQSGMIFSEDGELVALSRQCMTYFE